MKPVKQPSWYTTTITSHYERMGRAMKRFKKKWLAKASRRLSKQIAKGGDDV